MITLTSTEFLTCITNSMQIASHLPKILTLISSYPVVSIVAPTGSGKSIGIPAAIASTGAKCFVSVPTRTAAISLAEYQRVLQRTVDPKANVNKIIGYAAEGNVNYGPDTMVAYVTGGHMRKKMLSYFAGGTVAPIDFCDVLFTDEVHSGSIDTTVIISLWMTAAAAQVRVPRLVIASATPVPMVIEPTPQIYTVDLAAYPIEYRYLDKDFDIDDPSGALYTQTANLTANIHRTTPVDSGHILVFTPGSAEVETVASSLRELLKDPIDGKIVDIIPAFGALKQEDIALIYKQTAPNERKIVIATNIAEMSITIEDVGYVVDTMVEKRAETSQSGGFRLTTHYISKDSAKQRAGRTGRTRPGISYRMCTQERYEKLEEHRPPEIERVPIYETVMELLDVGLTPELVLKGIDIQRITGAVQLLMKLGMVVNSNGGVTVTDSGHFAPNFPLSVRNAAFLWQWIQAKYPVFPGIVTAALIDCYGPSYFWIPRRKPTESVEEYNLMIKQYKAKNFAKYVGYNDLETSLNMWNDLAATIGGIRGSQRAIIGWSRDNSINNKKIRELLMIVEQSVNAAVRFGYNVEIGPFTTQGVVTATRPILLSVYSDMTLIQRRDITYFSPITKEEYRLDNRDAVNELMNKPPPGVIALVTAEIKTQRGVFRVIGFAVDTDKDGLGRPIVVRGRAPTPRGPRAITHPRQTANVTEPLQTQELNQALDLLATLNVGGDPVTQPTVVGEDIESALDLLATLNIGTTNATPTVIPQTIPRAQAVIPQPIPRAQAVIPQPIPRTQAVIPQPIPRTQAVIPQPIPRTQTVIPQPAITTQVDLGAALDLLNELDLTTDGEKKITSLLPMEEANEKQLVDLSIIGSNPDVHQRLGKGSPWNIKYVRELYDFAIADLNDKERQYYHWIIILYNNEVAGYVGLHPTGFVEFSGLQMRYFVTPDKHGQGIATDAVNLMINKLKNDGFNKQLWAFIEENNQPSIAVAVKTGFNPVGKIQFEGKIIDVYSRMI